MIDASARPRSLAFAGGAVALLGLGGAAAFGASIDPLYVPLGIAALLAGVLLLWEPAVGVLAMFVLVLFKPEAVQSTAVSVNGLIAAVLAAVLVVGALFGRRVDFLRSMPYCLFLVLCVVSAVNWWLVGRVDAPPGLDALDLSTRSMLRLGFQLAFLTFITAFIRTPRQLALLTGVFVVAVFWTIPGALTRTYSAEEAARSAEALRAAAVAGVQAAENANRLAFIALMAIALIWFAMQHYRSALLRVVGIGLMGVLTLTVLLTGSRSGLLNLALLPILLMAQSRLRARQILPIVLFGVLMIAIGALFVPQPILDRLLFFNTPVEGTAQKSVEQSTARRFTVLQAGLELAARDPFFGIGIGNFRWATAMEVAYGGIAMAAHNAYLLALAEGGIVLLGVYLLLFWWTARELRTARWYSARLPAVGLDWLVRATRTNLIMLLVFSLFAEAWKEFYFVLIIATSAALGQIYRRAAAQP
jgi:O-antigen ligase